jgi:hypothetical protein
VYPFDREPFLGELLEEILVVDQILAAAVIMVDNYRVKFAGEQPSVRRSTRMPQSH